MYKDWYYWYCLSSRNQGSLLWSVCAVGMLWTHTVDSYLYCYFLIFASFVSVSIPSLPLPPVFLFRLDISSAPIFHPVGDTGRGRGVGGEGGGGGGGEEGELWYVWVARVLHTCSGPGRGESERFICRNLRDINIIPSLPALLSILTQHSQTSSRYSLSCKWSFKIWPLWLSVWDQKHWSVLFCCSSQIPGEA